MKDILYLQDGTEIAIESGASLSNMCVLFETKEEMLAAWNLLTEENLKNVQIKTPEGEVIGEYADLVLENETSVVQSDGTILTCFSLRQKTEVELLKEQAMEQSAAIAQQSETIEMLTECVLEMSEQVYA